MGLGQAAARWEAHPLGANGGPKGAGEGTRAGRWGCRGLRTGKAKRGWQTGTASYEHEGAENMGGENMHDAVARVACRAVGGPREQGVGRGERAATMCGMAAAAGMAMRGAEAWAACRMERGPREL